jgi:hypothetical protein
MAQEVIEKMKNSKVEQRSKRETRIGRPGSSSELDRISVSGSASEKAATRKGGLARSLQERIADESKSNRLVCRYCGSEDLAPSFIKRRDRRCRKWFSRRYGSAARGRKPKLRK